MLVTRILGDCPECGGINTFGNVSVSTYVQQGCKQCHCSRTVRLPVIKKKVIYLDQAFFSTAMRAKNPKFTEAMERVKRMTRLQLLVAPYSSTHEQETEIWRGTPDFTSTQLLKFIKASSRGAKFEKKYLVERNQLVKGWNAFLKGEPPEYQLETDDAITGNTLTKWDNFCRFEIDGGYPRDIELARQSKNNSVRDLTAMLDQWQESTSTFDQAVALEVRNHGKSYTDTYLKWFEMMEAGKFVGLKMPMQAHVVQQMLDGLPEHEDLPKRLRRCVKYFCSPHFAGLPHVHIPSQIFGTLRELTKAGSFANRGKFQKKQSGIFEDIDHVALYAPYCSAIFVDKFMAGLICRPTVDLPGRYGTKVFSATKLDALLAWLDNLEADMSDDHRQGFAAAYGGAPS